MKNTLHYGLSVSPAKPFSELSPEAQKEITVLKAYLENTKALKLKAEQKIVEYEKDIAKTESRIFRLFR
jgi:hypothetical protein